MQDLTLGLLGLVCVCEVNNLPISLLLRRPKDRSEIEVNIFLTVQFQGFLLDEGQKISTASAMARNVSTISTAASSQGSLAQK
jgi:hypothetical protein